MAAEDHLGQQFPVYEMGDPSESTNPRYHVTAHEDDEEVHPSHFGFNVVGYNNAKGTYRSEKGFVTHDIPIHQADLTQDYVYKNHVHNLASVPQSAFQGTPNTHELDPVESVRNGDRYSITHGAHRTVAAKLRGDKTIRTRLVGEWHAQS